MIAQLRRLWPDVRRLLFVFGIFGLIVWPAAAWLGYDLVHRELTRLSGIHVSPNTLIGRDFVNIWHGGREALNGADGIYDRTAYRHTLFDATGIYGIYAFSYPPHMLMLAIPFGLPSYPWALALWTAAGFGLFAWVARPWLHAARLPVWSVLLLPGTVVNLWAGHFGYLIGALALYGWHGAGRNPLRAGAAFALMSVKPHMGIVVPLILIARREWRTIAATCAGVGLLVLASTLLFGIGAWTTWFSSTLSFQVSLIDPSVVRGYAYMMPTVGRMMLWIADDPVVILAGQLVFGAAALALLFWAVARRVPLPDLGLLSLAVVPLLLPYSFDYDLVALSLAALLWAARSPARWWSVERLVYGAAFLVPLTQAPFARFGLWLSPVALIAALAFAAWRMIRAARAAGA